MGLAINVLQVQKIILKNSDALRLSELREMYAGKFNLFSDANADLRESK